MAQMLAIRIVGRDRRAVSSTLPLPLAPTVLLGMRRILLLLPFLGACYTHAPIEPGAVRPRTSVRARVNAAAAEQLEPLLGISNARLLSGVVIAVSPETLLVEVPTGVRAEIGSSVQTLNQRVAIARSSIVEIETRRIDRRRTGLVVGAASLIAGAFIYRAVRGEPGSGRPPDCCQPTERRVRILRFSM